MSTDVQIWYLTKFADHVELRMRLTTPDGSIADVRSEIHPGETLRGKTYAQWRDMPEGSVSLPATTS